MKKYYDYLRNLAFSGTAKDTYILFSGNVLSAFLGFLFTLFVARALSIADFGVFSATLNLVVILTSLGDIGLSSGVVNFISEHREAGNEKKVHEYMKAALVVRFSVAFVLSIIVFFLAPYISKPLLATTDATMGIWAAILPLFIFPDMLFPYILQAKKKFLQSTIYDNSFYLARLAFAFIYYLLGALTIPKAYWAFGLGFLVNIILTFVFLGKKYLYSKPTKVEYKSLLKFSGWIAVNRIISSVSGRLDVQMLAAMAGAVVTGLYSIPSRLASFIIVLAGSFSSVLATRLAAYKDRDKEKSYILKSTLALIPISLGVIFVVIFAKPFITILFGEKYLDAVPIFQALALAQIPFLFTVPPVTAIIYALKKTVYIGTFAFFQVVAIFLLNFYFIPKYGPFGPTFTYAIVNTVLLIYSWSFVVKHYWFAKS